MSEEPITIGELRRSLDELKTFLNDAIKDMKETVVLKEVYKAEQDHLKDRISGLESSKNKLIAAVSLALATAIGELVRVVIAKGH